MDSLLELFCDVDDFCQIFKPAWKKRLLVSSDCQRQRVRSLTLSEIMTIVIYFHQSHYRTFKAYYKEYVLKHLHTEFPNLVSYSRFVEFMSSVLIPLSAFLRSACFGSCSGISFIDSTALVVCDNHRIAQHRVLQVWPSVAKPRPVGFSASNYIWWSTIAVKS